MKRPLQTLFCMAGALSLCLAVSAAASAALLAVDNNANPQAGSYPSLAAALMAARAGDQIVIRASTTSYVTNVALDKNVTIRGEATNNVTLASASGGGPVITVAPGIAAQISNVTVTGGTGDPATGYGGGICNQGTCTLTDCAIGQNAAVQGGGGVSNGVGVSTPARLTMLRCAVRNNHVIADGFAGGGVQNNGVLTMTSCILADNDATAGGGLRNEASAVLTHCTITTNMAVFGGGISNDLDLDGNTGSLTMSACSISGNTALYGAGMENRAVLTLTQSTLNNNTVSDTGLAGGGLSNSGDAEITNCTIAHNEAPEGAGLYNNGGQLDLTSLTISLNTANEIGGGLTNFGIATLTDTIVAGNTASHTHGGTPKEGTDVDGPFTSNNNNLIGIRDGSTFSDQTGDQCGTSGKPLEAYLEDLNDNGGPTLTMALGLDSPAIDKGSATHSPPVDQRGVKRPQFGKFGPYYEVGAFELPGETIVTNTSDSAAETGSLRWAVNRANANGGFIKFQIPGAGVQTIVLGSPLPRLTQTITIDGWSQGGGTPTNPPLINLVAHFNGAVLEAANDLCVIRGLSLGTDAPTTYNVTGVALASNDNWVYGCTIKNAGSDGVVISAGTGNVIGSNDDGTNDTAESNTISGGRVGVRIGTSNNRVAGNRIVQNTGAGIAVNSAAPYAKGNAFLHNEIQDNGVAGIDLGDDGPTVNDEEHGTTRADADTGPNDLLNYPEFGSIVAAPTKTTVSFTIPTTFSRDFIIEFYTVPAPGPGGYGEGQALAGTTRIAHTGNPTQVYSAILPPLTPGTWLTATATAVSPNPTTEWDETSEFSPAARAFGPPLTNVDYASDVTLSGATLHGQVNPYGQDTTVTFEYGLFPVEKNGRLGQSLNVGTVHSSHPGATEFMPVSLPLSGLTLGTTYYYRVVATNAAGKVKSPTSYFVTLMPVTGTALQFDGVDDVVALPASAAPTTLPMTVAFWFRSTDLTLDHSLVQQYVDNATAEQDATQKTGWRIGLKKGKIDAQYFRTINDTVYSLPDGSGVSGVFSDNNKNGWNNTDGWHYVVFTVDNTGGRLYLDGQQSAGGAIGWFGTPGAAHFATPQPVEVGAFPGRQDQYAPTTMDDIRIWSRTAESLTASPFQPLKGTESGLTGYYPFDEGAGVTTADRSPVHNGPGSLVNIPTWVPSTVPLSSPPSVITGYADPGMIHTDPGDPGSVGTASTILRGEVSANNRATSVNFNWGTTTSYGNLLPGTTLPAGAAGVHVAANLSGLTPGTTYHYRATAAHQNEPDGSTPVTVAGQDSYFVAPLPLTGTALSFDGVDNAVKVAGFGASALNNEVTVEFWERVRSSASPGVTLFMSPDDFGNRFSIICPWTDGKVKWDFGNVGGGRLEYAPPGNQPIASGQWEHFAFVASRSGNYMKIFRNGVVANQKTGVAPFNGTGKDMMIGVVSGAASNGDMDEVRIWSEARTAAQIQDHMNGVLTGQEANLVAYYRLDEGAGRTITDSGPYGYNGAFINNPLWIAATRSTGAAFTPVDVARALMIAGGLVKSETSDARLNVDASGAGVDLADVMHLARKAAGLEPNP